MAELHKFIMENKDGEPGSDQGHEHEILQHENTSPEGVRENAPLLLEQVRVMDMDGNLKVLYPSKTDLTTISSLVTIIH